jgi:protein BCP1
LALKRLIVQQFQSDAELIMANELANLVLAEPRLGSTIKCDGPESDPYAFLTAVNMTKHKVCILSLINTDTASYLC